jgi:isoamylase
MMQGSSSTRSSTGGDRAPKIPYADTVIYEAHVKGLTQLHPGIPEDLRGTYAAIAHPAIIEHLKKLGVTALELMPVHQFVNDSTLQDKGLVELLGLQHDRLLRPAQRVRRQPAPRAAGAGIQGDGSRPARSRHRGDPRRGLQPHRRGQPLGPTLSFRGIDNAAYYRLVDDDQRVLHGLHRHRQQLNVATRTHCS